jgi:hypothetical protein
LNKTFPDWDEPTLLKTLQCMVLVGEKSLQQQVLQAVPENGVVLAPFETVAVSSALTNEVNIIILSTSHLVISSEVMLTPSIRRRI